MWFATTTRRQRAPWATPSCCPSGSRTRAAQRCAAFWKSSDPSPLQDKIEVRALFAGLSDQLHVYLPPAGHVKLEPAHAKDTRRDLLGIRRRLETVHMHGHVA